MSDSGNFDFGSGSMSSRWEFESWQCRFCGQKFVTECLKSWLFPHRFDFASKRVRIEWEEGRERFSSVTTAVQKFRSRTFFRWNEYLTWTCNQNSNCRLWLRKPADFPADFSIPPYRKLKMQKLERNENLTKWPLNSRHRQVDSSALAPLQHLTER